LRLVGKLASDALPSVVSIANSDAGQMTFAQLSMAGCLFNGAHGLSSSIFEANVFFANTPRAFYARRRCIADEIEWRASKGGWSGSRWKPLLPVSTTPSRRPPAPRTPIDPSQIANLYRELRRSHEARADQPGAADFYYGEMEMRRLDPKTRTADRLILNIYWVVSGYGLHALRSFACFGVLVLGSAALTRVHGFESGPVSSVDALIFSLRSALPGLRRASDLTPLGASVDIAEAVLGPLLFGLGLLAIRGRVRR
jgi:hypothetical protein